MPVAITGSAMRTCLGGARETFEALLAGRHGASPLRLGDPERLRIGRGYGITDDGGDGSLRASRWLAEVVAEAVRQSGIDPARERVAAVVGTGLRETRSVERWHCDGDPLRTGDLHFGRVIRELLPGVTEVHTLSGACAASGYALGLAMDLLAAGEADAVVAAGCDSMTESMLAVIGKMAEETPEVVRPFDDCRGGVLLGDGAAAMVLRPADAGRALALVRGVGLNCDARHETAPDRAGIVASVREAYRRAGVTAGDIELILAHGTGTGLNDPTEAAALLEVFGTGGPPITAIKGAIGHTSGAAAMMSMSVAISAMHAGTIPPVTGLRTPITEAEGLSLVHGEPLAGAPRIAQVNAFGFGGLNAVAVLEHPEHADA